MDNFFDNRRLLLIVWNRKFHFVIVGIVAVLISAIFSGPTFIAPKFKSTARVYPTNISVISEESETEQMLEVINSRDIALRMFDAFHLGEVYKIKKDDPQYLTNLLAKYNKNVSASKTQFETVEIKVMDADPQRASNMCDSIIHFYNEKVGGMHRLKRWEMVEISQRMLDKKNVEYDTLKNRLTTMQKTYGVFDLRGQSPEITRGYMNALSSGRASSADGKKIEKLYNNFTEKGTEIAWLEKQTRSAMAAIDSISKIREVNLMDYEKKITYSHVVEHPIPADKNSYPVRWLIVVASTFSAVFMAFLIFLVLDYRKWNDLK